MSQGRFVKFNETSVETGGGWKLCFQFGRYEYGDGTEENGYRFIWRKPNTGNLQSRGQARIPSISTAMRLMSNALEEGWGCYSPGTSGSVTSTTVSPENSVEIELEVEEE